MVACRPEHRQAESEHMREGQLHSPRPGGGKSKVNPIAVAQRTGGTLVG